MYPIELFCSFVGIALACLILASVTCEMRMGLSILRGRDAIRLQPTGSWNQSCRFMFQFLNELV
jgi:hypothetical protein